MPSPQTVCHKRNTIGKITESFFTYLYQDDKSTRLDLFTVPSLTDTIADDFFLFASQYNGKGSAIDVDSNTGNQMRTLDGECIVLRVKEYELKHRRNSFRTTRTANPMDCLAFRALYADVSFEAFWDDRGDMDIAVFEPNGRLLYFGNTTTDCGSLVGGNNFGNCRDDTQIFAGHERIIYDSRCPQFQKGLYTVRLTHHRICGSLTRWDVRVSYDGVQIASRQGASSDERTIVTEFDVQIPPLL